jgi:hypothetical protein
VQVAIAWYLIAAASCAVLLLAIGDRCNRYARRFHS